MAISVKQGKNKKVMINQIIIKAPNRKVSDIGTWRNAIRSADTGRPRDLFDLFEDLYLDGILHDAVDKRISAVTNSELTFQDARGEEIKDMVDVIDSIGFEELLNTIMKARFWGRSGCEFDFSGGFAVNEIPAKHIDLNQKVILLNETDTTGISYENDDHILITGKRRDYGLFIKTAPLVIWKRGGFGDYAQWLEIFGMPQRVGKYNSYDPEARKLLEDALEKAGSAPYVVIPIESQVETVQNTGTGSSGSSYNEFRQACNEETLITILGQTLTTVQGEKGARALGEVHKLVEEGKNKSDMRFVQRILNTSVLPILDSRGFPVSGGKFIFPKAAEPLTVPDIVSLSGIMPIPVSYLNKKYSIPMPKDGEPVAGARQEPEPGPAGGKTGDNKPTVIDIDTEIENADDRAWFMRFLDFFVEAPAVTTGAMRNFTTKLTDRITGGINLADPEEVEFRIDIGKLFERALREVYKEQGNPPVIEKHLFDITNNALQSGIGREFKGAGMEFGKKNQAFIDEFKYNASVFSAFKNHQQTKEIVSLLTDDEGNLRSFYDFKKRALKVSRDYNENWLRTEYNTAVRAARQAVNWKNFEKSGSMYPNLEYIKSTASNRRALHEEWAGTILPIGHEWWDTHYPPSDWNCQCSVRQTDKPETGVPDGSNDGDPVFKNNPGKTARFVNLKEHPYYKKTADKAAVEKELQSIIEQGERERKQKIVESRNKVKQWMKTNIPENQPKVIEYSDKHIDKLTITRSLVKTLLAKGHENPTDRNLSVMHLKALLKNSKYFGWAEDEVIEGIKKHLDVDYWIYYKSKVGYICVKVTNDKERLYKPYAIVDSADFENIKGVIKENPPR
jgi:hypothetical protein